MIKRGRIPNLSMLALGKSNDYEKAVNKRETLQETVFFNQPVVIFLVCTLLI